MNGRKISGYEKALAPSTVFAVSPAITASQVRARVNSVRMPITDSHAAGPAEGRKPSAKPTPKMIATVTPLATSDVRTCAHSTLDRAIGMEWNRSTMPPCRSVNSRKAV